MRIDVGMHPEEFFPLTDRYDEIADALAERGFIILDAALPEDITARLLDLVTTREHQFKRAGVGRDQEYQLNNAIRGDAIQWLENGEPAVDAFLSAMDQLRNAMNERLFMGLFDYDAHFASYAPGAFYKKHRDAFRGNPGRKLSSVFYLNAHWEAAAGGELVIYSDRDEEELVRVAPEYGRLVLFLSEEFPHEVLPARRQRHSIAGWFRIKT